MLRSKTFESEANEVEEWYQTKYNVEDFNSELLNRIVHPNIEFKRHRLALPPKNNLIPKNFDILPKNEIYSEKPVLLK